MNNGIYKIIVDNIAEKLKSFIKNSVIIPLDVDRNNRIVCNGIQIPINGFKYTVLEIYIQTEKGDVILQRYDAPGASRRVTKEIDNCINFFTYLGFRKDTYKFTVSNILKHNDIPSLLIKLNIDWNNPENAVSLF
jgi:hypothetical protein